MMKVTGTNFTSKAVILWNGSALATTVIDSNTLSGAVTSSIVSIPATVQLKVQNVETGQESTAVPLVVASTSSSSGPSISTTQLPGATAGVAYSATLAATGGVASDTWSVGSGQLPPGLSLAEASGIISGTPTTTGNFSFGVTITSNGSPAQSASSTLILSVTAQAPALVITSTTLPSAIAGSASYSSSLKASGGTAPYTWSITSDSLPSGLSLATTTGIVSGTPTATGVFTFTVAVTDAESPAQSTSGKISLSVMAAPLTITSTLPSGTDGTAYSAPLKVSGGTPAYTWSITSGSLPAGLSLSATTGVISGTPTVSGTSSFTATVSDNSNPAETKSATSSITVAAAQQVAGPGATWYVRPDGGTRYSANVATGQCDGTADTAYSGSGTNQHCAFNDVRMLWQDGSYTTGSTFPGWGWVIAGGDTVIIRGSIGTGNTWRVGANSQTTYCDSTGCWGITGSPSVSGPPPPSGTAAQHTRILGENYGSCTSASAKTQLHGGNALFTVLDLSGSSYVDVACLDITDFSACGRATQSVGCNPTQDYAQNGVQFSNQSTNDTLTDVHIHGMATQGIFGPTGDGVALTRIDIIGNASSGWNADLSDGTTGVGSLLVQNFLIWGNGCAEQYPLVYPAANSIGDCTDQSSGGYGDGFGTATTNSAAPGWQVHFDQGTVAYNTQDGLDALHIGGTGSSVTHTRVMAFGNEGQQLKVGGATATIQNSVIIGNCEAMTTVASIPTFATGFGSKLGAPCRAGNTAILINVTPGDPATFQDNTVYEAGAIGLEVEYATSDTGPTNTLKYNNNIFAGFYNAGAQENSTTIFSNTNLKMLTNPGSSWTNNVTFGQRGNWACPHVGESNAICSNPGLIDETYHTSGYGNMAPSAPGSIVLGAGVAIPGITTDYTGTTRNNPPSIGAYE
jgi:hypothetical protein